MDHTDGSIVTGVHDKRGDRQGVKPRRTVLNVEQESLRRTEASEHPRCKGHVIFRHLLKHLTHVKRGKWRIIILRSVCGGATRSTA
jgi:hypothetical protein